MGDEARRDKLVVAGEVKVLDPESGIVQAVVSSETLDRDGDIIRVAGWDLKDFNRHPVLLSSHNYGTLKSQIGTWTKMEVKGKRLVGTAQYFIGAGNEEADWAWELIKRGVGAYSVGFIPDMEKAVQLGDEGWWPTFEFNGQLLLEASQVTVPSNPDGLQRMKGLGRALDPVVAHMVDTALWHTNPDPTIVKVGVEDMATELLDRVTVALSDFKSDVDRRIAEIEGGAVDAVLQRLARDRALRERVQAAVTNAVAGLTE